eukprot:12839173-Alexandrium_andersonii.AAC.1
MQLSPILRDVGGPDFSIMCFALGALQCIMAGCQRYCTMDGSLLLYVAAVLIAPAAQRSSPAIAS